MRAQNIQDACGVAPTPSGVHGRMYCAQGVRRAGGAQGRPQLAVDHRSESEKRAPTSPVSLDGQQTLVKPHASPLSLIWVESC